MKSKIFFFLMFFVFGFFACVTTSTVDKSEPYQRSALKITNPQSLGDFLVRVPGVYVDDWSGSPVVLVRGRVPLFVVDGVRVGRNYAQVNRMINIQDIVSVEVLRRPNETVMWGREGANGVILIRTGATRDPI
ncbi:MAG: TonB-dependent receptor plug domain-containing protein [Saprospiraceae bacterium]|nr:TonB-dependent receptor plug domain-containing protein [Saprospiraceae bacterium]